MIQFISIINYVIFCTVLVEPLRFSRKKTCMITFICFFLLCSPQLCFPSFFHEKIDSTTTQFTLNIVYWFTYIILSYGIIFLILKRDWLHHYFYLMLWDIITGIILAIISPLLLSLKGIPVILPLLASALSIFFIKYFLRYYIQLPEKLYGIFLILYTLFRIITTFGTLHTTDSNAKMRLLLIIFVFSALFLISIFIINYAINHYIHKNFIKYQNLFDGTTSSTDKFLSYLKKQWNFSGVSLEIYNPLTEAYFLQNSHLYYLLIACNEILLYYYKNASNKPSKIYLNIQQKMNYIIISAGCIQPDSAPSLSVMHRLFLSYKEILLSYLLKQLHGQVQFLDEDIHHTQIRIAYLT